MSNSENQFNFGMNFTADTSQAKKSIENLVSSLDKLSKNSMTIGSSSFKGFTSEITKASQTVTQLKYNLQSAVNTKTGNLDLSKFNLSLINSGQTLSSLKANLLKLGPEGQTAFNKLTTSILTAEGPLRQTSKLLIGLGQSLKNVFTWQISTRIFTGLTSIISEAFRYAEDLNESLNNIRIVTGYSTDQMAEFAKQANVAAQALSTTTTAYTDAALIYYQQGLKGDDVIERTNATVKMANVTGDSVDKVSNQLTAIWNNFYDGSESLEHYADVMTALGAATASSTDEIAEGIEKFAATGKTVGLSYEYAAAALATVTATTRQSADVVGTAFKTIFARLEDLKLGNTLDDETTLGKYSSALATAGVNIKDASGNLKDMDDILTETAAKWGELDRAQKVALAQTVSGIRQYTQFMALMDNWDFMEQNIGTAENSTGELSKQAKIYEESWQGASKRVKSAIEEIYNDLLDDNFIVGMIDGFAKFLNIVENVVKGLGGMKGLLAAILQTVMMVGNASGKITNSIATGLGNMWSNSAEGRQSAQALRKRALEEQQASSGNGFVAEKTYESTKKYYDWIDKYGNSATEQKKAEVKEWINEQTEIANTANEAKQAYNIIEKESEKAQAVFNQGNGLLTPTLTGAWSNDGVRALEVFNGTNTGTMSMMMNNPSLDAVIGGNTNLQAQREEIEEIIERIRELRSDGFSINSKPVRDEFTNLRQLVADFNTDLQRVNGRSMQQMANDVKAVHKEFVLAKAVADQFSKVTITPKGVEDLQQNLNIAKEALKSYGYTENEVNAKTKELDDALQKYNSVLQSGSEDQKTEAIKSIQEALTNLAVQADATKEKADNLEIELNEAETGFEGAADSCDDFCEKLNAGDKKMGEAINKTIELAHGVRTFDKEAGKITADVVFQREAKAISGVAQGLMSLTQIINVVKSLGSIWSDKDASVGEKLISTISTLSMAMYAFMGFSRAATALKEADIATTIIQRATLKKYNKTVLEASEGTLTFGASLWTLLGPILPIVAAVGALVAVIVLLAKAIEEAEKHTLAGQLKTAQEEAQKTSKALQDATQAVSDLKSGFDNFDSIQDTLQNCTKYTTEWYDALREAQNAQQNLINNSDIIADIVAHPEKYNLTGDELYDEDGLFTDAVQKAATKEAIKRQNAAAVANGYTQQKVNYLDQQTKNREEPFKDIDTLSAQASYDEYGTSLQDVALDLQEYSKEHSYEDIIEHIRSYKKDFNDRLETAVYVNQEAVDSINDYYDKMQSFYEKASQEAKSSSNILSGTQGYFENISGAEYKVSHDSAYSGMVSDFVDNVNDKIKGNKQQYVEDRIKATYGDSIVGDIEVDENGDAKFKYKVGDEEKEGTTTFVAEAIADKDNNFKGYFGGRVQKFERNVASSNTAIQKLVDNRGDIGVLTEEELAYVSNIYNRARQGDTKDFDLLSEAKLDVESIAQNAAKANSRFDSSFGNLSYDSASKLSKKGDSFKDAIQGFGDEIKELVAQYTGDWTSSDNIDFFEKYLEANGIEVENLEGLEEFENYLKNIQTGASTALKNFQQDTQGSLDLVNNFLSGDKLSEEDFEKLKEILPDVQANRSVENGKTKYTVLASQAKQCTEALKALSIQALKGTKDTKQLDTVYATYGKTLADVESLHRSLGDAEGKNSAYALAYANALEQEKKALSLTEDEYETYVSKVKAGNEDLDDATIQQLAITSAKLDKYKKDINTWLTTPTTEGQGKTQTALESILGTELSPEFIEEHKEEIKALISEDSETANEALKKLQAALQIKFKIILDDAEANNELQDLYSYWEGEDLEISANLDDSKFVQGLNKMLEEGKITAEEAESILAGIGYAPDIGYQEVDVPDLTEAINGINPNGPKTLNLTKIKIPYIKGAKKISDDGKITPSTTDDGSKSSGSQEKHKVTSFKDKTQTIENQIKEYSNQINDLQTQSNRLKDLLNDEYLGDSDEMLDKYNQKVEETNKLYKDQISLLEQEKSLVENELTNVDTTGLEEQLKAFGLSLGSGPFDASALTIALDNAYNASLDAKTLTDAQKDAYSEIKTYISNIVSDEEKRAEIERQIADINEKIVDNLRQQAETTVKAANNKTEKALKTQNADLDKQQKLYKSLQKEVSKFEKEIGKLSGKDKVEAMQKLQDLYQKQLEAQSKIAESAKKAYDIGLGSLKNKLAETGIVTELEFLDGEILNDSMIELQANEKIAILEEQVEQYKAGTLKMTEEELSKILAMIAQLKQIPDILKAVNDSANTITDAQESVADMQDQIQSKYYEMLIEKLNSNLKLIDNELKLIDYNFKKLSSNFYTMGEAAGLFLDKGEQYLAKLAEYQDTFNELNEASQQSMLNQKDYADGLQTVFDGILDSLGSIQDLSAEVKAYYGQTVSAAKAELENYMKVVKQGADTLKHYESIMKLIGRDTDYASLGKIYEGMADNAREQYEISKQWYQQRKADADEIFAEMNTYEKTSQQYEILHQTWVDALNEADSAYQDMMSNFETYMEAFKTVYENTLNMLAQELENKLTNNTSFDYLIDSLDRLEKAEEEYLTKTNQVYELNKLNRQAQQELDKADNAIAKQKLQNFIDQNNQLKDKNKMSNFELEIQKAQYDLLIAQMALEDTRNAKNKVRLQRTSEGGYGYVYTADQDAIAEQQQKYEDAQNALYNLGLEHAAEYTDKYSQILQEYYEKVSQLQEDRASGAIETEEEYQRQMLEIQTYYYDMLKTYADLYEIAITETDDRVAQDTWTSQVDMMKHTDIWQQTISDYVTKADDAWDEFKDNVAIANEMVGATSEDTAQKVGDITTATKEMTSYIKGPLMSALEQQIQTVKNVASAYADWIGQIQGIVAQAEQVANKINGMLRDMGLINQAADQLASTQEKQQQAATAQSNRDFSAEIAQALVEMAENKYGEDNDQAYRDIVEGLFEQRGKKEIGEQYIQQDDLRNIIENAFARDQETLDFLEKIADGVNPDNPAGNRVGYMDEDIMSIWKKNITGFASGGYTGAWQNDNGKLALLHEKELVLNAQDTQNILDTVDVVRQITQMTGGLPGFGFKAAVTNGADTTLQQDVHIDASFPNVSDHNEIELALNNLVNAASQYAMK